MLCGIVLTEAGFLLSHCKHLQHLPGERSYCSCKLPATHVNHRLPWVCHQVGPAPDNNTKTTALDWTRPRIPTPKPVLKLCCFFSHLQLYAVIWHAELYVIVVTACIVIIGGANIRNALSRIIHWEIKHTYDSSMSSVKNQIVCIPKILARAFIYWNVRRNHPGAL